MKMRLLSSTTTHIVLPTAPQDAPEEPPCSKHQDLKDSFLIRLSAPVRSLQTITASTIQKGVYELHEAGRDPRSWGAPCRSTLDPRTMGGGMGQGGVSHQLFSLSNFQYSMLLIYGWMDGSLDYIPRLPDLSELVLSPNDSSISNIQPEEPNPQSSCSYWPTHIRCLKFILKVKTKSNQH